jgi:hypothetical protein
VISVATSAGRQLLGPEQRRSLERIADAMDDLRAVLGRMLDRGDRASGLQIVIALEHWWPVANVREGQYWLEQLLADTDGIEPGLLGRGLSLHGLMLGVRGDIPRAIETQERARGLLREAGDERAAAWATHYLGIARWSADDPEPSKRLTLEALAAFGSLNEPIGVMRSLWWLVLWELEFGSVEEAIPHEARIRQLVEHLPIPLARAHAAEASGLMSRVTGDVDGAGAWLREAVVYHTQARNPTCLSHCLEHVALWLLDTAKSEQAAELLGAVDAIRNDVVGNTAVPPFERLWHDRAMATARENLGDAGFTSAWERGRSMSLERAVAAGHVAVGAPPPGNGGRRET